MADIKKPIRCTRCNKRFKTKEGMRQHRRDIHELDPALTLEGRKAGFEMMAEDLPDGAYFAMAEEFGLSIEDLID